MLIYLSKRGIRRMAMGALPGLVILAAAAWFWTRWAGWVSIPGPWGTGSVGRKWDAAAFAGETPLEVEERKRIRADLTGDGEPETVIVEIVYTARYDGRRLGYYRIKVEHEIVPPVEREGEEEEEPGSEGEHRVYVLHSPLWEGLEEHGGGDDRNVPEEMLAGAYGAPFSVKALDVTGDGLRELLVLGKAGRKDTPFYIYRWDGESYNPVLSELFWGNPRLIDANADGMLEVQGHVRVVAESTVLRRYAWRGGRWVALSGEPNLAVAGGELVGAVLDGVSQSFLGIPLPNPIRWFAQEWIEDPNGWTAWQEERASWVAVQIKDVEFLSAETNERAGTWKVLGWIYEVSGSGEGIERLPALLTFETVREAGEWRIRDIRREDPEDGSI